MSLLLDALKKSDAQRRRGNAPQLDLSASPPPAPVDRRLGPRGLIALIAAALVAGALVWFGPELSGRFGSSPEPEAEPGATAVAMSGDVEGRDGGQGPPLATDAKPASGPETVVGSEAAPETETVQRAGAGADPEQAGEPPEPASAGDMARNIDNPPAPADEPDADSPPLPDDETIESARVEAAGNGTAGIDSDTGDPGEGPGGGDSGTAEPEPAPDPVANFIRPWELPEARRAQFPELDLTVHFYGDRPADRFVLINGERYAEGDRIGQNGARNVLVHEIRRRGVVVEFGDYRVMIE